MKTTLFAAFAALAFAAGCTTADSTDLKTSGIYATITATGDGAGKTQVSTVLQLGPLSTAFVQLKGMDALTATSGTQTVTLKEFNLLGLISYTGTLDGDAEGKAFTVALTRSADDKSAPMSTGVLPAQLTITSPAASAQFKRGTDPIEVKWDNAGKTDPIEVELSGTCVQTVSKTPSDTGSLTIAAADLKPNKEKEMDTCDVTVSVKRTRAGTLDPAYGKGGTVRGIQQRSVKIVSKP